jgi:hypothetical protein
MIKDVLNRTIEKLIDSGGDPWEYDSKDIQKLVKWIEVELKKVQTLPIDRNASDFNVKLMYGDGFLGRNYYMFVNEVKIDICNNNGDFNIAKEKTLSILKALNIQYQREIKFEHDGCW